jgi:hypothetical protein
MSIMPGAKSSKPKLPVTISVSAGSTIYIPDYAGAGKSVSYIRNDDTSTTDLLTLSVNCMTITGKPNNGLVSTEVRIFNESSGSTLELAGQDVSPTGMQIVSFKVVSSDSGTINITVW